jgi:hypothetical protein
MANHVVQQGECLSRIAAQYGFLDFRTIYNDAGNSELRNQRPDPNILFPGDVVFIPDKKPKEVTAPTTKVHRFRVPSRKRVLRIVVEDLDGKKLASKPYELDIEGNLMKGVTSPEGLIEKRIPVDAVNGALTVGRYTWPLQIAHLNPVEEVPDKGISGIQARLRNLGYDCGPIDGIIGPLTEAAIADFQVDHPPLKVDGVCGAQTRAALIDAYGC